MLVSISGGVVPALQNTTTVGTDPRTEQVGAEIVPRRHGAQREGKVPRLLGHAPRVGVPLGESHLRYGRAGILPTRLTEARRRESGPAAWRRC